MFSKNQISLFIIVFCFLFAIGVGLKAHFWHDVKKPDLSFTSNPEISCNIDGWTFTHRRVTAADGKILLDRWFKIPKDPEFKIEAKSHGFGWAHTTLYGKYDGKSYGDAVNSTSEQLARWIGFLPVGAGVREEKIELAHTGSFNRNPKQYSWDGSGSIKLVPVYWKWSLSVVIPSGSWEEASADFHTVLTDMETGTWTVKRDWRKKGISGSDDEEDDDDDEEEDSEDSEDTSPSEATVPDRPGSFELSPYRVAIKLKWEDSASDGGADITDYQYQYQRKVTATGWSAWSDWTSGGTGNFTWITGLTPNRRYAVRMRAVNSVGSSPVTGIKMVNTTK